MSAQFQREVLGYDVMAHLALRGALRVVGPLSVQASLMSVYAPSAQGAGQMYVASGGLRADIPTSAGRSPFGAFIADANAGIGQTASLSRAFVDAGVGFEVSLTRALRLGPVVRYGHLFATRQDFPSDAGYWSLGASVSLRAPGALPTAPAPPRDTDHDGVLDLDDLCPREPMGAHPDADRRGCPERDRDGDLVRDADDLCIDQPAGAHPDPERRGCPSADTDSDGLFDRDDRCPTLAQGAHPDPERAGCPDGDEDQDAVTDHQDQCRSVPKGDRPDPDRLGCPAPDRDGDSVRDAVDACPDRPGAPSTNPRRNGCPGLVRIVGGQLRILRPVFFATNRDAILPQSFPLLAAVADALRADAEIVRLSVEGHTDDVAADDFNLALSDRRARRVMEALVARGVPDTRLEAHGFGESHPIVQGRTRAARATNRRVEFRIIALASSLERP